MKNILAGLSVVINVLVALCAIDGATAAPMDPARIEKIATEAYTYLYPLVLMDVTRQQQTRTAATGDGQMRAPVNQFVHLRAFPPGDFKDVVRPNFDTLYSSAWLDLSKEPVLLSVGDTKGRYYLLPLYDMWTDIFAVPGSETLGPEGGTFAITAPGWRGKLPAGVERIEAPTSYVWIIGRVQTNGPSDYEFVHNVQQQFQLAPLSQWGKPKAVPPKLAIDPTVDPRMPPLVTLGQMPADAFFERAMHLMQLNPAHIIDQPMLARMKMIGLIPGAQFSFARLSPDVQSTLKRVTADAYPRFARYSRSIGQYRQGWRVITTSIGSYGADYLQRALIALGGLGANRPDDAIYPRSDTDSDGQPLDGTNQYVLHFNAGEWPPMDAFWSLTAYDKDGFTVPNKINRYAIGDRDGLVANADGSLDLYLQFADPGPARAANWLPIAPGRVSLSLRLYLPKAQALSGQWPLPTIKRVDTPPITQ